MKIINILLNYQLYFKKFAVLRQLHQGNLQTHQSNALARSCDALINCLVNKTICFLLIPVLYFTTATSQNTLDKTIRRYQKKTNSIGKLNFSHSLFSPWNTFYCCNNLAILPHPVLLPCFLNFL